MNADNAAKWTQWNQLGDCHPRIGLVNVITIASNYDYRSKADMRDRFISRMNL